MMGKVDIAVTILVIAIKETSSKEIEKKMILSSKDLQAQLGLLESKGLIRFTNAQKNTIMITKRGEQFLNLYSTIKEKYLTVPA